MEYSGGFSYEAWAAVIRRGRCLTSFLVGQVEENSQLLGELLERAAAVPPGRFALCQFSDQQLLDFGQHCVRGVSLALEVSRGRRIRCASRWGRVKRVQCFCSFRLVELTVNGC